ncbi:NADH dehydrogenase ubiquinone Fe-S protein 4 [Methylobacterium sp. P31]
MKNRAIGIGHNNPPAVAAAPWLAGGRAMIRRLGRPVESTGRARAGSWVLTFERTTPEIEPLMGWIAGGDPLATEVRLTFPTRAQAVAYAQRQGLAYLAEPEPPVEIRPATLRIRQSEPLAPPGAKPPRPQAPASSRIRRARKPAPPGLPDLERALINPAAVFATPAAVLDHPRLLGSCKREILRRWAWDEYLKEVAAAEGMAEGEPSQLEAVKAALLALGERWRPHPAAPAAAIPVPPTWDERVERAAA